MTARGTSVISSQGWRQLIDLTYCELGSYRFGARLPLAPGQMAQLTTIFQTPERAAPHLLGGRRSISRAHIDGIGDAIVKHYRRGGLLSHLISRNYFNLGKRRCQIEFEQLERARAIGINTPEPIAFAYQGRCIYRAWLVTREVRQAVSLAQLSQMAPERARIAMGALKQQMELLVTYRMRHADFHPGNVLVDAQGQIYLLDFDKAGDHAGNTTGLRADYVRRWCRAVHKHKLPPMLCELIRV